MLKKQCSKCKNFKFCLYFGANTNGKKGLRSTCKECTNYSNRLRYQKRKHIWQTQKYFSSIKKKYGITQTQWTILYSKSNGKCFLCDTVSTKRLCVDHDHVTGKVRGLLCHVCNTLVGLVEKQQLLCIKIDNYLGRRYG